MNTRASITKLYLGITYVTLIFCANLAFSQSINTIVIDAGHGGKDHGCRGAFTIEKELTLAMAQKIKQTLNQSMPEIQVMLTRESDVFIPLSQRNSLANAIGADLFLSLHCNHIHIESVQGTEAYVLGENTIQEDHSIAERENAALDLEESITDEAANDDCGERFLNFCSCRY